MRVQVHVKPNAKKTSLEKLPNGEFRVAVKAPAQEGKANEAVVDALARHFNLPKSAVCIVRGLRSKKKIVEVAIGL